METPTVLSTGPGAGWEGVETGGYKDTQEAGAGFQKVIGI